MTGGNRWEVLPDEFVAEDETVSADALFADLMAGYDSLAASGRGEIVLQTTQAVRAEEDASVTFYNAQTDELYLMASRQPTASSEFSAAGVRVDYDADGKVVGFAIAQASSRLADVPRRDKLHDRAAA